MKVQHFVGIDISKYHLDFSVVSLNSQLFHMRTENSLAGIKEFIRDLKKGIQFGYDNTLFCMEHTGIYNNFLLEFLYGKKALIWLESAIHIKQSSGLKRGKNDKVDALRIAQYAYKNRDDIKLWSPKREIVEKLKHLTVLRRRLINAKKQIKTPIKESVGFLKTGIQKQIEALCEASLKALQKDITNIDKKIAELIKSDPSLKSQHELATSVDGIGTVTAAEIIVTSNEFKDISQAKKYACYAGVVPFEHSSGSSVRGKARVSNMANKTIKTLLSLSAMSAINHNEDIKNYYQRKVSEGKNPRSVINAVRNKLVHRVYACIRNNKKYEKNYNRVLA